MRQRLRPRIKKRTAAVLVSLTVFLTFAVVALVTFGDGRALAAKQLSCGDTITTDTTLHHNLVNCPNNGILIGADNITLDLNYHTIDGDGTPVAGCDHETEFCDVGVVNFGHDGVTVVHGSLRQFAAGVDFGEVRHNRLLDISASRNRVVGIQLFSSSRSLIRNSSGRGSLEQHKGGGLDLFDSDHVRIVHNSFRNNGFQGIGVFGSNHNLIKGNLFSGNRESGITLEKSDRNNVRRNRSVRDGEFGIYVARGSRNVIVRSRVFRTEHDGVAIDRGHDNLVARNVVGRAGDGGIRLGSDPAAGGANNVVRRNRVRASGEDGFQVRSKDDHSLLERNIASGAKDDGFEVESHSTKLTRNGAVRNGDLGIEAVRGVIDGGGNVARHNGDPRQCINIVCR